MDHRHTQATSGSVERRRVRSISQPGPSYAHTRPSGSTGTAVPDTQITDSFDYDFLASFHPLADPQLPASTPAQEYDDAAFQRALAAFQQTPFNPAPSQTMPTPPPSVHSTHTPSAPNMPNVPCMPGVLDMSNMPSASTMSGVSNVAAPTMQNPTQALLAALPWLQLMYQMQQNQYGPQIPQPTHPFPFISQPQQQTQPRRPESSQPQSPWETTQNPFSPPQPGQTASASPASSSAGPPSPPQHVEVQAEDPVVIAEDKRRRNTAASARFRIKKKQWTLNLERTISDLASRVQELEVEAAELRRENGWLKEIVMLKSKQNAQASAVGPGDAGTSARAISSQPDLTDPSGSGEQSGGHPS